MRKLSLILAGLLAGAAVVAAAQTAMPETRAGVGADVSGLAKVQRRAATKGVGVEVREKARAQAVRDDADGAHDDDDTADGGHSASNGLGAQVRTLAKGRRAAESKGVGTQARDLAHARSATGDATGEAKDAARAARTDAKIAKADAKAQARVTAETRATVAAARADVAAARTDVRASREQVKAARDAVKAARQGRGS